MGLILLNDGSYVGILSKDMIFCGNQFRNAVLWLVKQGVSWEEIEIAFKDAFNNDYNYLEFGIIFGKYVYGKNIYSITEIPIYL